MKKFINRYFESYRGLPKKCWKNIVFNLINSISVGVCFFLSLYFVEILNFSMALAGLLMSSYGLGTVVGGFVSGKLCDYYRPRILIISSLLLQSLAYLSLTMSNQFEFLLIILFLLGTSNYSFKTANNVLMLSYCLKNTNERLKSINVSYAASNFGLGISGVIIGLLADEYGYQNIFLIASILLIFSAVYFILFPDEVLNLECRLKKNNTNKNNIIRNKRILFLALAATFFVGMIIAQLGSTYPVYIKNVFHDFGTKAVSILFILDTVLIVLFQAPLSIYYQRFETLLVMGFGAFLMGAGMMILSMSSIFILAIISCCVWTFGEMLFIPTAQLLCYEHGNTQKKGQNMGIFQSIYAMSIVLGPYLGGFLYSEIGADFIWHSSFIIGVTCLIVCLFNLKRNQQPITMLP